MNSAAPPTIFAPARRTTRASRAARRQKAADAATFVLDEIAEEVAERLQFMRLAPRNALVIGDPSGAVARAVRVTDADITALEIGDIDEEAPLPNGDFDLIVSALSLDTINDLPGALIHIRNALARGGIAMAALPAAANLPSLRAALLAADGERPAARMHPAIDAGSGAALMQRAGFARQVADGITLRASYRSLDRLVADLRDQGMTGVLASQPPMLSKTSLKRANDTFMEAADDTNRVIETFELVMLTGWKT